MNDQFSMNSYLGQRILSLVREGDYAHAGEEEAIDLAMAGVEKIANRTILDIDEKLYDQFGQNLNFRLAMVSSGGTAEFKSYFQKMPSADYVTWVWTGGLGSWRTIMENGYESYCKAESVKPVPEYFALADTSGTIRRFYDALDTKQVERMVQHIAILLPTAQ